MAPLWKIFQSGAVFFWCLSDDCFDTYFMMSLAAYYQAEAENYNMQCIDLTGKKFLFQIGGPRSLELLEKVTKEDLHDVK